MKLSSKYGFGANGVHCSDNSFIKMLEARLSALKRVNAICPFDEDIKSEISALKNYLDTIIINLDGYERLFF